MENLDVIQLIENNPLTRLSQTYQNKFIEKIQETFTHSQQQIFVASFYCYLNFNSKTDFVIDLDNVWKWLGFGRKEECKRVLTKNFVETIDYKVSHVKEAPQVGGALNVRGCAGLNKEAISLNINTFKKLCLKSRTKKADEIHDYFIKLEEIFQDLLNEESDELKTQLENNKQLLLENQIKNTKEKQDLLIHSYHKKCIVYLIKVSDTLYKFGFSNNIKKRMNEHKRLMKLDILLVFCIESKNNVELENKFKEFLRENPSEFCKRVTKTISGNDYTEFVEISGDYDVHNLESVLIKLNNTIGTDIEVTNELLSRERGILELENENIKLKIQLNQQTQENLYIKELEYQLQLTKGKVEDLAMKLNIFQPIIKLNTDNIFTKELYEKFVQDKCEIDKNFKCSGKDLMLSFKEYLQNTVYQEQVNNMYDLQKFSTSTNYFLPSFKKEFYNFFETLLNYKASGMKFRNKETLQSENLRGFVGIRLKINKDTKLYDDSVYLQFFSEHFTKDSRENKIQTTCIQNLFVNFLKNNDIPQSFRQNTPEFSQFKNELCKNISLFYNIQEQRIKFDNFKSPRPGYHWLKLKT